MRVRRHGPSVTVETPAKINLFLEILGRRTDGYHELESLFVAVNVRDTLTFTPAAGSIELLLGPTSSPVHQSLPLDGRNLIVKAANLLRQETGVTQGAQIVLHKRIPAEAGLGGGSSDAAATLVGLARLWNLNIPREQLHAMAAQLGSDVNFFLDSPVAAICRGRGERVTQVPLAGPLSFVIVKPSSGCATGDIFRRVKLSETPRAVAPLVSALQAGNARAIGREIHNALQEPALGLNAEIENVLQILHQSDVLGAGMTGSGSACFALCHSWQQARILARQLASRGIGTVFSASSAL